MRGGNVDMPIGAARWPDAALVQFDGGRER
jgi:hypothetical protein